MEQIKITVANKELPLDFDLRAWVDEVEPKFGSLTMLTNRLGSQDKPISAGVDMLVICANAGYRRQGSKERITREWLLANVKPAEIAGMIKAGKLAITQSFAQEITEDVGVVDEVLAEIEKKETGRA